VVNLKYVAGDFVVGKLKNKNKNMKILTTEELENMNQVMTSIGSLIITANS
jgi:hypothetical protein